MVILQFPNTHNLSRVPVQSDLYESEARTVRGHMVKTAPLPQKTRPDPIPIADNSERIQGSFVGTDTGPIAIALGFQAVFSGRLWYEAASHPKSLCGPRAARKRG